jgi:hypothetical protein
VGFGAAPNHEASDGTVYVAQSGAGAAVIAAYGASRPGCRNALGACTRSGSARFSNGLDPARIAPARHLIRELVNEGQTALLSSHQFDEVQKIFTV